MGRILDSGTEVSRIISLSMATHFDNDLEEGVPVLFNRLVELFESESEDEPEEVDIPQDLYDFLTIGHKGPKLDEQTVRFLCENGVTGMRSFLLYVRQSFNDMMSSLSNNTLAGITRSNGLRDVKMYGDYVFDNSIIDLTTTNIDFTSLDLESYQLYLRSRRRAIG